MIKCVSCFFSPADNSKVVKRGRVPKGFLSSNTAYMLVYKKVTNDGRMNNGKKTKVKKVEAESNSHNDIAHMERLTVKDKSDSPDDGKRKNGPDSTVPDLCSTGKILKLDMDDKMDTETLVSSSDNVTAKEEEAPAAVDSTSDERNGKHYESDNKENHHEMPVKKSFMKNAKVDYKQLNGDAHRAMSCGERDFYEEVGKLHLSFYLFLIFAWLHSFNHFADGVRELGSQSNAARFGEARECEARAKFTGYSAGKGTYQ